MKAETAAILAVFGHLRNSNIFFNGPNKVSDETDVEGNFYTTRISYTWEDQRHEYIYTLSLTDFDLENERLQMEIRTNNNTVRAELKKVATQQYAINFLGGLETNGDVVPWFKIDKDAKYIHDGYHQNADEGEEGPFTGSIELHGLRAVLNGYYNNKAVRYIVTIEK